MLDGSVIALTNLDNVSTSSIKNAIFVENNASNAVKKKKYFN